MHDPSDPTIRGAILTDANNLTHGERNKTYGSPRRNMRNTAVMIGGYLEARGLINSAADITAEDAAIFLVLTKLSRMTQRGAVHRDNYVDAAAYIAMAGECATIDREAGAMPPEPELSGKTYEARRHTYNKAGECSYCGGHASFMTSPFCKEL